MPKRPENGRGLFHSRDSGGEHETTPGEYVRWAQAQAKKLGVHFAGTSEKIEAMVRDGRPSDGDLFLDYGVKGNQLTRPGLDELVRVAMSDLQVSHIFIPRRDRLARPDNPIDAMKIEERFRRAGITLVFMDKTLAPIVRGRSDLGESIVAMIDYDQASNERRELAQKMLYAQLSLARAGYSTGGRPPYGFRRWLVQGDGRQVRELAEGEYVRMAGHHVVWLPGPDTELCIIRRVLKMLETMPASRVAAMLTAEGVPSPDAGRFRTDRGVKHQTSGVWHQSTVTNIARNPLLRAIVEYGRRSMGDRLRFDPNGPRELDDSDCQHDGRPKTIVNPVAVRIQAPAQFKPLVDPDRLDRLLTELNQRGGTQRGKPRSQDPKRNPLGGRVFDLACGWPMYRRPFEESFRYVCGLYQQSHATKCNHNWIDGLLVTRFMLGCIRQRVSTPQLKAKLEDKLRAIAQRSTSSRALDSTLADKQTLLATVHAQRVRAGENLALAKSPDAFSAVEATFEKLKQQEASLEAELQHLVPIARKTQDAELEVAAALAGIDRIAELALTGGDLGHAGMLFTKLNARIFLRFEKVKLKARFTNQLLCGVITLGATPPPVALYEGPTGRRQLRELNAASTDASQFPQEQPGLPGNTSGQEGDSYGNVNRGDRI